MSKITIKGYRVFGISYQDFWEKIQASLVDHLSGEEVHRGIERANGKAIYHLNTGVTLKYGGANFFHLFGSEEGVWRTRFTIEDKTGIKLEEIVD